MKTKEAIEFLEWFKDSFYEGELRYSQANQVIELLQRGEEYEKNHIGLIEELEKRQQKINELEKYRIMWIENKYYSKSKKIRELEQKYFPKKEADNEI